MPLLGFITGLFLIGVIAVECLFLRRFWTRLAWGGLFLFGIPWICLYGAGTTGHPFFLLLIPVLYGVIGGGFFLSFRRRRGEEEQIMRESHGWRCPFCKSPNAAVNLICCDCQTPRP